MTAEPIAPELLTSAPRADEGRLGDYELVSRIGSGGMGTVVFVNRKWQRKSLEKDNTSRRC